MQLGIIILSPEPGSPSAASPRTEQGLEEIREFPVTSHTRESASRRPVSPTSITKSATTLLLVTLFLGFELVCMFPVLAVLVILFPFLRITQYFVRLINLLKTLLGIRIVRIQVRVILSGQFLKSLLDIIL